MANVTETSLTANIYEHPCSYCGAPAYGAMVSPHVHPNSPSPVNKYTIEMNGVCSCGCCCSCFEQEERDTTHTNTVMTGHVYYVCRSCCPNLRDDEYGAQMVYRYCVLCWQARCPECGQQPPASANTDGTYTCVCGNMYDPASVPLSWCVNTQL